MVCAECMKMCRLGGKNSVVKGLIAAWRSTVAVPWKRVVLALNSAASQQGHGTAILASHAEPGVIPESLRRNNAASV